MTIREGSRQIVCHLLNLAVKRGDLVKPFAVNYDKLTDYIGLQSENFCRVCFQYLNLGGYIRIIKSDDDGTRHVELSAKTVDFLGG